MLTLKIRLKTNLNTKTYKILKTSISYLDRVVVMHMISYKFSSRMNIDRTGCLLDSGEHFSAKPRSCTNRKLDVDPDGKSHDVVKNWPKYENRPIDCSTVCCA